MARKKGRPPKPGQVYEFDFYYRCELARASEDGLRNPSGLFIRSVQHDWTAPPQPEKTSSKTWYTPEEFDNLIEH
jgi:hypothetical protein